MTAAKFADEIGIHTSSISHFLSGRNKPSTDILVKILDRFRGINAEWLLTGRGSMYKSEVSNGNQLENKDLIKEKPDTDAPKDLFNLNSSENESEKPVENTKERDNTADEDIELNRSGTSETVSDRKLPSSGTKKLEKIILLYSDNSFEYYSPNM